LGWYSFYLTMKGRRLRRPQHFTCNIIVEVMLISCVQPVTFVVVCQLMCWWKRCSTALQRAMRNWVLWKVRLFAFGQSSQMEWTTAGGLASRTAALVCSRRWWSKSLRLRRSLYVTDTLHLRITKLFLVPNQRVELKQQYHVQGAPKKSHKEICQYFKNYFQLSCQILHTCHAVTYAQLCQVLF